MRDTVFPRYGTTPRSLEHAQPEEVTRAISRMVHDHLNGKSEREVARFLDENLLTVVSGILVGMLGAERAKTLLARQPAMVDFLEAADRGDEAPPPRAGVH